MAPVDRAGDGLLALTPGPVNQVILSSAMEVVVRRSKYDMARAVKGRALVGAVLRPFDASQLLRRGGGVRSAAARR